MNRDLRITLFPMLRGMRGLAATVAVTALVPMLFLRGQEDWNGMGFPLVVEVSAAVALVVTLLLVACREHVERVD